MRPPVAMQRRAARSPGARLLPAFLIALASAALLGAWGGEAHDIITAKSLRLLPAPLKTWLAEREDSLLSLAREPDRRVDGIKEQVRELERLLEQAADTAAKADLRRRRDELAARLATEQAKHFFDIDALTDEGPPFADFPRQETAARRYVAAYLMRADRPRAARLLGVEPAALPEALSDDEALRLGAAAMTDKGTLPWAISDTVTELTETFRRRDLDHLPAVIGRLAHYVGDLHQPLHTTMNYDGKLTGNTGVHSLFEIDMLDRYADYYRQMPREYLRPYDAVGDVAALVFARVSENASLTRQLLATDTEARKRSNLSPEDVAWLKAQDRDERTTLMTTRDVSDLDERRRRVVGHVDTLHFLLREAHGDLARRRLGAAASDLASLVYTAWLEAGRPPLESPPEEAKSELRPFDQTAFIMLVIVATTIAVLLLRRKQPPPRS